jgi:DNA polymerase-3 subunit alpha
MGKKKPEEMAKQRAVFLAGAKAQEIGEATASRIFDLMEKFAGYGFNKSHSAAYALIAYQTAWLKGHFPESFMAAVMTADMDVTDKLVVLKDDCKQLRIAIDPPNVNQSAFEFTVAGTRRISYGLGAIKGVGQNVVEAIVAERVASGPFESLLDMCRRLEQHKLNRRVLEALVRCGALDGLGMNRATSMAAVPDALRLAECSAQAAAAGQATLFGGEDPDAGLEHVFVEVREWNKRERLEAEQESLGLYLTGHPFDDYAEHCRNFSHGSIANVVATLPAEGQHYQARRNATLAGVVMNIRRRASRLTIDLDDNTGRIEATLFDEIYNQSKHLLTKHAILVIDGQLRYDDFLNAWRLTAQRVRSIDEAIEEYARRITICWNGQEAGPELVSRLKETLQPFRRGKCEVCVQYQGEIAQAQLTFGDDWTVRPTRELREQLGRLLGEERYSIHYQKHFVPMQFPAK